jgi:hypothetical protein
MKKFEYQTIKFGGDESSLLQTLNKVGSDGWELVQVAEASGQYLMFFKRELK